jgi:hypothetical protein
MTDAADPIGSTAADPLIGSVFGERYRIDARLGGGGMGAVYRARHLALQRDVAVKVLHAHLTEDPTVAQRFDREALASSRLDHRNCLQVLDTGTSDTGLKYLVMQLLEGSELRQLIRGPMPPPRVVEITAQILLGLEHAHRRGLVHRDLKPENVFVTRTDDGEEIVKLVDFGIVKVIAGDGSNDNLTRAGVVFGTPAYMSPEQAAGGKIDERTDLYAVGIIMYEMLLGAPPFRADEVGIVLRMQLIADPPPLPDTVPAPLRGVVMRLLEKDARDRFASARATREALEAAASPVEAVVVSPPVIEGRGGTLRLEPERGGTQPAAPFHASAVPSSRVVFMRADALAEPANPPRNHGLLFAGLAIGSLAMIGTIALAMRGCDSSTGAAVVASPAALPLPPAPDVAQPADASPPESEDDPVEPAPEADAPEATRERESRKKKEEKEREGKKKREEQEREAKKKWKERARDGWHRGKKHGH